MKLRQIRYFQVLAEELNFSRAAERLYIAQPPLSRQIQALEEKIGVQLFHRTKRQVQLTNAGKVFLKKSYEILELVEDASIEARLSSTGTNGEFRIGFSGTVQDLIPILKMYRKELPHISVTIKQMTNEEQILALHENKIDIALVTVPINHDNIQLMPIKKLDLVAALPEEHPLTHKSQLFFHDLVDETFIMTPNSVGSLYYERVLSLFKKAALTPNVMIHAFDLQTALVLVAANMGITLAPSPSNSFNGIVLRKIEDFDLSIVGSLAWRIDNNSEVLERFLIIFLDYYEEVNKR